MTSPQIRDAIVRLDFETRRRARLVALRLQLVAIQAAEDKIAEMISAGSEQGRLSATQPIKGGSDG